MTSVGRIALAMAGFLLLAASLVAKKRAGWLAVLGGAVLAVPAVWDADPTLVLGVFALVAARLMAVPRKESRATSPKWRQPGAQAGASRNRP